MLVFGVFGSTASYMALAITPHGAFGRYLIGAVIFLVVLAGRAVARTWAHARARLVRHALGAAAAAMTLCFAAGVGYLVSGLSPANPAASLANWLGAHGLTSGVGAYWDATITTVESGGKVEVRPVIADPNGRLVRYTRESTAAWYTKQRFQFLVFEPALIWNGVDLQTAAATFGPPSRIFHVGGYEILVWHRALTMAPSGRYGA